MEAAGPVTEPDVPESRLIAPVDTAEVMGPCPG